MMFLFFRSLLLTILLFSHIHGDEHMYKDPISGSFCDNSAKRLSRPGGRTAVVATDYSKLTVTDVLIMCEDTCTADKSCMAWYLNEQYKCVIASACDVVKRSNSNVGENTFNLRFRNVFPTADMKKVQYADVWPEFNINLTTQQNLRYLTLIEAPLKTCVTRCMTNTACEYVYYNSLITKACYLYGKTSANAEVIFPRPITYNIAEREEDMKNNTISGLSRNSYGAVYRMDRQKSGGVYVKQKTFPPISGKPTAQPTTGKPTLNATDILIIPTPKPTKKPPTKKPTNKIPTAPTVKVTNIAPAPTVKVTSTRSPTMYEDADADADADEPETPTKKPTLAATTKAPTTKPPTPEPTTKPPTKADTGDSTVLIIGIVVGVVVLIMAVVAFIVYRRSVGKSRKKVKTTVHDEDEEKVNLIRTAPVVE